MLLIGGGPFCGLRAHVWQKRLFNVIQACQNDSNIVLLRHLATGNAIRVTRIDFVFLVTLFLSCSHNIFDILQVFFYFRQIFFDFGRHLRPPVAKDASRRFSNSGRCLWTLLLGPHLLPPFLKSIWNFSLPAFLLFFHMLQFGQPAPEILSFLPAIALRLPFLDQTFQSTARLSYEGVVVEVVNFAYNLSGRHSRRADAGPVDHPSIQVLGQGAGNGFRQYG
mmetsp:Transcript_123402/g.184578  ORF Transcript_123402/g.184578 Transcript_123402/m.184578 type:complete len:222 (-) Transcript_123402:122-787(-)